MQILGIDFGEKKIGLAIAEGLLAEPSEVLKINTEKEAIEKVLQVIKVLQVDKVVVGISEGRTAKRTKEFVKKLQKEIEIPIELHDETLSTQEAQRLSLEAGLKRVKRKNLEDAFAATVMLQDYLDNL